MAEEKGAAPAAPESTEPAKKKPPIKTIAIVLVLLVVEAVVVFLVVGMVGGPGKAKGEEIVHTEEDAVEQTTEVQLVADRFPNHNTGRVWLWDTEVQIKIHQRDLESVEQTIAERSAEIRTGISQIVRTAHHNHLKEPNLETLTRQITAYLRGVFGQDGEGRERVVAVLLPKCVGFPADF